MAGIASAGSREEDTALVVRIRDGDNDAFGELYDRWFDRVYDLALRITRDPGTAGDVAQDAFLSAWQSLPKLENPDAFGGWLLRITRNRAFNTQRKEQRTQASDTEAMAMIERAGPSPASAPAGFRVEDRTVSADDPARATEDSEIVALVWDSVDALGQRDTEVLELTLRHGYTPAEVADVVGTNRNAANQIVHRARNRLKEAVAARVLWRGGTPECGDLADVLAEAGITRFGADAVRVTTAHATGCDLCTRRQELRLDPAAMFGAVPFVAGPVVLKQKTAHALMADGVPMKGSAHFSGDAPPGEFGRGNGEVDAGEVDGGGDGKAVSERGRRIAQAVGAIAVVVVLAIAGIVALADTVDHGTVDRGTVDQSAVRSQATTSTIPQTSPTTPIAPSTTVAEPPVVVPPTAPPVTNPPPPPPPEPPAATATATMTPPTKAVPPPNYFPRGGSGAHVEHFGRVDRVGRRTGVLGD